LTVPKFHRALAVDNNHKYITPFYRVLENMDEGDLIQWSHASIKEIKLKQEGYMQRTIKIERHF
jgi:hypothetical protein